MTHPLAGKPAPREYLIDVEALVSAYYTRTPDPDRPQERVSFGTSGHRGSALGGSFNEAHILATTQAICEYRRAHDIDGPLLLGRDTHALSEPAQRTALEVLAAHDVEVLCDQAFTPTPAISHAILTHNRHRDRKLADGIVVTPSHNPPEDGGFKYNPPHGGPADSDVTGWVQNRANELLRDGARGVRRFTFEKALRSANVTSHRFIDGYVTDLPKVIDMGAIAGSSLSLGVDPLGGASVEYWQRIAEVFELSLDVVNPVVDPQFGFMALDHDGKIRMDCSSPWAMAPLVHLGSKYALAFGNDPDADRHGIVVPSTGLMNPNHYLAVAIRYLFTRRTDWPPHAAVGKTLVSSSLIDRVSRSVGRTLREVPVGFKYFVSGLADGSIGFGGEESAGASFLRFDGRPWTTDKDGIVMNLLAAEITAISGKDPGQWYEALARELGRPHYVRIDQPATPAEKARLKTLSPESIEISELAGEPILEKLTRASGEPIGGLKVVSENGWFAARPSGTEDVYKIYAESFRGPDHLDAIVAEAREIVSAAL